MPNTGVDKRKIDKKLNGIALGRLDALVPVRCHGLAMEKECHPAHETIRSDKDFGVLVEASMAQVA